MLLQLVLETENIFVSVETDLADGVDGNANIDSCVLFPPTLAYPPSSRHQLLYLNTSCTCVDIINKVVGRNLIPRTILEIFSPRSALCHRFIFLILAVYRRKQRNDRTGDSGGEASKY